MGIIGNDRPVGMAVQDNGKRDDAKKHVIIIGAGVGGASLAARLAHRGYRVTVFEKVRGGRSDGIC